MSTATSQRQTPNGTTRQKEPSLLEQVISQSVPEKVRQIDHYLTDPNRIAEIEALLPDFMKGQAERLAKRARLTFAGKDSIHNCNPASFIKCVLQAAELGFAIDGRLCHAVPYGNELQLQVDYKGMIAVAKRSKLVQDCWARRIHENDHFAWNEQDGKTHYEHSFNHKGDRGPVAGILSVATHSDGWYRADWVSIKEVDGIKLRSKSYQGKGASPWRTDEGEMQKKTGIKRLLKTFTDDPGLIRLLEIDDQDTDFESVLAETVKRQVTAAELRSRIAPKASATVAEETREEPPDTTLEPFVPSAKSDPIADALQMSVIDQFRAKVAECDSTGAVDLLVERDLGEGSALEAAPEEVAEMREIAKDRKQQLRDSRGKK